MGPNGQAVGRELITGASSGIGLATAIAFGERGLRVALLARSQLGLDRSAAQVLDAGGRPLSISADVTNRDGLQSAVEQAATAFGGIDIAVVNAGAAAYGPFSQTVMTTPMVRRR